MPQELGDIIGVEPEHVELVGRADVPQCVDRPEPTTFGLHPGRHWSSLGRPPLGALGPTGRVGDHLQPHPFVPVAVGVDASADPLDDTGGVANLASG